MEKEFVPYEEALALKVLGFDKPCLGAYDNSPECFIIPNSPHYFKEISGMVSTPLYQQAFSWFREEYGIHVEPVWDYPPKGGDIMDGVEDAIHWTFVITEIGDISDDREVKTDWVKTYEEAELECLRKLIISKIKNG
jgi:hypothetical protein